MLTAIILGLSAVLVLLYGTRKTVEDHYVLDRPAVLGGEHASTGEVRDTSHQRSLHSEPTVASHIADAPKSEGVSVEADESEESCSHRRAMRITNTDTGEQFVVVDDRAAS